MTAAPLPGPSLTVNEVVDRYQISRSQLLRSLSLGKLSGYKVRGQTVREWRVPEHAVLAAGIVLRERRTSESRDEDPVVLIRRLNHRLKQEQARTTAVENRLRHALLTIGALRDQLTGAGIRPEEFGRDLEVDRAERRSTRR